MGIPGDHAGGAGPLHTIGAQPTHRSSPGICTEKGNQVQRSLVPGVTQAGGRRRARPVFCTAGCSASLLVSSINRQAATLRTERRLAPLVRRPRNGEGLGDHRVSRASGVLQKGTLEARHGKGQRGNEYGKHSQGHTGGQPRVAPSTPCTRFPRHKTEGPETLTATQVKTLPEPPIVGLLGQCGLLGGLGEQELPPPKLN